jgi:Protein of unknown function (DUF2877)
MRALDLGVGARTTLSEGARGRVIATYARAFYLRFDTGVIAVTDATAERGPIHLRCPFLPTARVGEEMAVRGNRISDVDLSAPVWAGDWVVRPGSAQVLAAVASPDLLTGGVPDVWPSYREDLAAGDLGRAAEVLGGLGPGLTPAGDDVLGGLLLVASALGYPRLDEIEVRTNEISAAYLSWAARGQGIEAAHDVLVGRDGALDRLLAIGASSGAAIAYGIGLGLRYLPTPSRCHAPASS